jgi:hypothetical protein
VRALETELGPTPIWGVRAIAKAIRRTERATFHLLENGRLPARRVGRQWMTTGEKLKQFFEEIPTASGGAGR